MVRRDILSRYKGSFFGALALSAWFGLGFYTPFQQNVDLTPFVQHLGPASFRAGGPFGG